MSVTQSKFLENSYKYCTLSIDSFQNRQLKGEVFHESLNQGMVFGTLSEMTYLLEALFDRQGYPMKSVDQRNFSKTSLKARPGQTVGGSKSFQEAGGKAGLFRLYVKYRYHATWQGEIRSLGRGDVCSFSSFLELMDYFHRELGGDGGKTTPAADRRFVFTNEFDLKEAMEYWMNLPVGAEGQGKLAVPGVFTVRINEIGPATFVVRVLFRRNSTCQGTIFWKEKQRQVNFRSFMEMLFLMRDVSVCGGDGRIKGTWNGQGA